MFVKVHKYDVMYQTCECLIGSGCDSPVKEFNGY